MKTPEEKRQSQREYMRQARESARKRGVCVICLKQKAEPNRSRCWECGQKELKRATARQNNEVQRGQHKEYLKERYREHKRNGVCTRCSKPAYPNHTMCYEHMIKARRLSNEKYARTRKLTYKEQGLCSRCGKDVVSGYKLCAECLEDVRKRGLNGRANVDRKKHPWKLDQEAMWRKKQYEQAGSD